MVAVDGEEEVFALVLGELFVPPFGVHYLPSFYLCKLTKLFILYIDTSHLPALLVLRAHSASPD